MSNASDSGKPDRYRDRRDIAALIPSQLDDLGLDPYEFRVYARIARRAGSGKCFESQANMAEACLMSERRVRDAMKSLKAKGLIFVDKHEGKVDDIYLTPLSEWTPRQEVPGSEEGDPGRRCRGPRQEVPGTPAGGAAEGVPVRGPTKESNTGTTVVGKSDHGGDEGWWSLLACPSTSDLRSSAPSGTPAGEHQDWTWKRALSWVRRCNMPGIVDLLDGTERDGALAVMRTMEAFGSTTRERATFATVYAHRSGLKAHVKPAVVDTLGSEGTVDAIHAGAMGTDSVRNPTAYLAGIIRNRATVGSRH